MKKTNSKRTLLLVMALAFISSAIAQRTISGTITDADSGEPLIGANVLVVGYNIGTITDIDGKYSISIPEGAQTLEFSYVGYKTHSVEIGRQNTINIAFVSGDELDDVVVIGYGAGSLKRYIEGTKLQIKSFYEEGNLTELNEYLEESINDCEGYSEMETCITDLSFTGGYYFQQASKDEKYRGEYEYIQLAENYYRQVLTLLPENKAARHNLSNLLQLKGLNESSVDWYQNMAEKYPGQKADYLMKLAELYAAAEGNSEEAGNYLWEAYSADPYNRDIYEDIVDLYKKDNRFFGQNISLTHFAYRSQKYGFPNFGEELLQHQVKNSFAFREKADAESAIIAWINMLVDNKWLVADKIDFFIEKNLRKSRSERGNQGYAYELLAELSSVLKNRNLGALDYWNKTAPEMVINEEGDKVRPIDITIKILYQKGEKAIFSNEPSTAEKFWQDAMALCRRSRNPMYPKIAKDLAKLYYTDKRIDRNGGKLENLVDDLFDAKGGAYRNGDKELIRDCHTTLGEIYYNLKKWDGGWATNARFQLERALNEEEGAIINPELREMLAVTYENTREYDLAQQSYQNATMDLLKLDQIVEAKNTLSKARNLNNKVRDKNQKMISKQLDDLVKFREGNYLRENDLSNKVQAQVYLEKIDLLQQNLNEVLENEFVSSQMFKGLSDVGDRIPVANDEAKQMIYSSALTKIANAGKLESMTDFNRIERIKTTLEKEVTSNQLQSVRLNNTSKITRSDLSFYKNYKTYQIEGLQIQVQVPAYLFELNDALIKDQKVVKTDRTKFKYDGRKIEKINY